MINQKIIVFLFIICIYTISFVDALFDDVQCHDIIFDALYRGPDTAIVSEEKKTLMKIVTGWTDALIKFSETTTI